jgi:hypothetical protein
MQNLLGYPFTAVVMMATVSGAQSAPGGPPEMGCQPGTANAHGAPHTEGWQMFSVDEFGAPSYEAAFDQAL